MTRMLITVRNHTRVTSRQLQATVLLLSVSTGSAVVSTFLVPSPWRFIEIGFATAFDVLVLAQSRPTRIG
jgi:hypothetical protein